MENSKLPEGVTINYKSYCKNGVNGTGENGRKCSNISIGDEVGYLNKETFSEEKKKLFLYISNLVCNVKIKEMSSFLKYF